MPNDPTSSSPRPGLLQSGLAIVEREADALRRQGKTVGVIAVANPSGVNVTGTAAWDTTAGRFVFSGELEKLRDQKSLNWRAAVLWSR
jgi:hypothetical protein